MNDTTYTTQSDYSAMYCAFFSATNCACSSSFSLWNRFRSFLVSFSIKSAFICSSSALPQVFADRNSITSDIWHKNVVFSKGEMYLIEAASGTGKSSLCSYIYGYRNDYQGIINFDETNIKAYSVEQWVNLRKHSLSMLFQDLRLFTELTALENIQLKNNLTG